MLLRELIEFVKAESTERNEGSFGLTEYVSLYTCRAIVEHRNSTKQFQELQMSNDVNVRITIRYAFNRFVPKLGMLIKWRDKILTVHGQPDLGEKDYLTFEAHYDPEQSLDNSLNES